MATPSNQTPDQSPVDPNFFIEAMQEQFQRLNARMDDMQERIARNEAAAPQRQPRRNAQVNQPLPIEELSDDEEPLTEPAENNYQPRRGRFGRVPRREPRRNDGIDQNLGSIKMKIPSFQGKNDPEAYLE